MGKSSKTIVEAAELPEFVQSNLKDTYRFAREINPAVYSGQRVAGFTDPELQAQSLIAERALAGDPTVQQAQGLLGGTLSGDYLNNPFLQQQIGSALQGAVNKATSQYALGGRLGSSAFAGALGSGITGAVAPILAQQYDAERGRQMQAAGMAPQLAEQRFSDLSRLAGVGQQQREMQQANLQATQDYINQLNAAKQAQFQARATAAGLGPQNPQGGTTTQTPSTMQSISDLGTAAALAYMAFSDERMKENVEQIQDPIMKVNMLDGVTFNYKNQPGRAAGLMAQDVERVLPMAVSEHDNGMKAVNYAQVTGLLTEAVKELSSKVARLESKGV